MHFFTSYHYIIYIKYELLKLISEVFNRVESGMQASIPKGSLIKSTLLGVSIIILEQRVQSQTMEICDCHLFLSQADNQAPDQSGT